MSIFLYLDLSLSYSISVLVSDMVSMMLVVQGG